MTFKLPEPITVTYSRGSMYTHAQLLEALRAWSEEMANMCDDIDVEYGGEEVSACWISQAIRNKAKELL